MTKILIVYTTTTGNTRRMADALKRGTESVAGVQTTLLEAGEAVKDGAGAERSRDLIREADGIVLGSPMRHRSIDARVKKFIEGTIEILWLTDEMVGKVGGVFTVGGGYGNAGGGVEIAQLSMLAAFAGVGMIIVTLPKTTPGAAVAGSHWGAHGRSGDEREMRPVGVSEEMLDCAFHHGANIARVASALEGKDLFARGNVAPSPEVLAMFNQAGK